jgi:hypothetical protein
MVVSVSFGLVVFVCVVLDAVSGWAVRGISERALADFAVGLREGSQGVPPNAPAHHCLEPDCNAGAICLRTTDGAALTLNCVGGHHWRATRLELHPHPFVRVNGIDGGAS